MAADAICVERPTESGLALLEREQQNVLESEHMRRAAVKDSNMRLCSKCKHEIGLDGKHHGHHQLDMHHDATPGPPPAAFGQWLSWWHTDHGRYVIRYQHPSGEVEELEVSPDGSRRVLA